MHLSNDFYKLFIKPDEESKEWDNKIFEYGEAKNIKKLEEHLSTANELYINEKQIYTAINTFTLATESKREKKRLLNDLKKEDFIKSVEATDISVMIKTEKRRN